MEWHFILIFLLACRSITRPLRSPAINIPLKFNIKNKYRLRSNKLHALNAAMPTKHALSIQSSWDTPQPGTDGLYPNITTVRRLLSRSSKKKKREYHSHILYIMFHPPRYTSCSHTITEPKRLKDMTIDCTIMKKKAAEGHDHRLPSHESAYRSHTIHISHRYQYQLYLWLRCSSGDNTPNCQRAFIRSAGGV